MARTKATCRRDNLSPRSRRRIDAEIEASERRKAAAEEKKSCKGSGAFSISFDYYQFYMIQSFYSEIFMKSLIILHKKSDPNNFLGVLEQTKSNIKLLNHSCFCK